MPDPERRPLLQVVLVPPVQRRPDLLVDHAPPVQAAPPLQQAVDLLLEGRPVAGPSPRPSPGAATGTRTKRLSIPSGAMPRLRRGRDDGVEGGVVREPAVAEDRLEVLLVASREVEVVVEHVVQLAVHAEVQHEGRGRVQSSFSRLRSLKSPSAAAAEQVAVRVGEVGVREHGVGPDLLVRQP